MCLSIEQKPIDLFINSFNNITKPEYSLPLIYAFVETRAANNAKLNNVPTKVVHVKLHTQYKAKVVYNFKSFNLIPYSLKSVEKQKSYSNKSFENMIKFVAILRFFEV